ncbi:Vacuolar protein sorting-associated protein ist1 [Microbotryomycetes sp. JL221]|nr:Vacuolar protein sorting-associated protein ist1 [Microbotryomycetes sp. JL221]
MEPIESQGAAQRLRLLSTKKTQVNKGTRREIAALLERGRIETARIKVEAVMGEDMMVELLEVLELYCELLLARFGLLEVNKDIDPGVQEAVIGIIHAAPRTELKELHILRDMLMSKGGRDFAIAAIDNEDNCVPERITSKLVIAQPPQKLVDMYLFEIAKAYLVDWQPEGVSTNEAPAESTPNESTAGVPSTPSKSISTVPHFDGDSAFPQTPPVDPKAADHTVILKTSLPSPGLVAPPSPSAKTNASSSAPTIGPAATPASDQSVSDNAQGSAAPATNAATIAKKAEDDAFEALRARFAELKRR